MSVIFSKPKKRIPCMYDLKRDIDYKMISCKEADAETSASFTIELLSGKFVGVTYSYGNIGKIEENVDDDNATLSFEFDVIDLKDFKDLENDEDFRNYIGEVLVSILMSSMEEKKRIDEMMENIKIIED